MSGLSEKDCTDSPNSHAIAIGRPRLSAGDNEQHGYITPTISPSSEHKFLVPSPMVTRRTRTFSASRRATEGPVYTGVCTFFSRSKGHGFIQPDSNTDSEREPPIFMHVSDIECDYVPVPGDTLSYKLTHIPPKNEKYQAVDVRITRMCTDSGQQHTRWDGSRAPL